jgi:hypothetical protein
VRLAALLVFAIGGCGFRVAAGSGDAGGSERAGSGDDGSLPDSEQPDAAPPWGVPTLVGFSGADDPTITGDLLEMYLNWSGDVWITKRGTTGDNWGALTLVNPLSTGSNETTPEVSLDGLTMLFSSDRSGGLGSGDIWMSSRNNRNMAWGTPVALVELNSTLTSERASVDPNIYIATRLLPTGPFMTPQPVTELNTAFHDGSVMLSADKRMICFDSDRSGNMEVWCATRPTGAGTFGAAEKMSFNDPAADDSDPWLSPDKNLIVWSSNRSGSFQVWYVRR